MAALGVYCLLVFFAINFHLSSSTCGYQACPDTQPGLINVHVVPHTHDDVGWLKTVDQYYYGGRNNFANKAVVYILDSVIPELVKNPDRRFIYVEMAFFWRWWNQQTDQMKTTVKQLVNEGRLEFINGGWCMNDEASTHYNSIIDQMTVGHKFLMETFGDCARPRAAWHIDPFGHSREQASLFAQMYFDGWFFGRIDTIDRILRWLGKDMEEVWHGDPNLGTASDLFYGTLFQGYGAPSGTCNDQGCSDPSIQDDPTLFDVNVDNRVANFAFWAQLQAKFYKTNNIMFTMGGDFNWENAHEWFKNLDKLIKYVNEKENSTGVHTLYSTPTCYLKSLNQANQLWGSKHEDFFPYRDSAHAFWTGYFTSRPALKRYERISNNFLQVCKQMEAFGAPKIQPDNEAESDFLKQAMAVAQHHDAVSGTEKQHVADDYALRLHIGTTRCQNLVSDVIRGLSAKKQDQLPPAPQFCTNLNISICSATESVQSIAVTVYNPLGRNTSSIVRIPVNGEQYEVNGPDGSLQLSQLDDVSSETKRIRGSRGNATKSLSFVAQTPALGFSTYLVKHIPTSAPSKVKEELKSLHRQSIGKDDSAANIVLQNGLINLAFNGTTGQLESISDVKTGLTTKVTQSFYYYVSSAGDNIVSQASGAYIFRPNTSEPVPLCDGKLDFEHFKGDVYHEIRQQCTPWLSQVVRVYKDERAAEFEWTVGPIPYKDKVGKEIITRFNTDIKNDGVFYTDANGRQILKRIRNHRETWIYLTDDPVSGNYYPVNSRIFINDTLHTFGRQLTVMTDRSQGGSSVKDGTLELMIHRRIFHDDGRGVGEPLNETGQFGDGLIIRGSHYVLFTPVSDAAREHRTLGERLYMPSTAMFMENKIDKTWPTSYKVSETLLTRELPANIHLLTLESWNGTDKVLLRLEHQFEMGEDADLSKTTTVSLKGLFAGFDVMSAEEMTLTANQVKANATRLQWRSSKHPEPTEMKTTPVQSDVMDITLTPFQIKTFILTIQRH